LGIRYFEDYRKGEENRTPGRTVGEGDIINFAGITGDWAQLHTNEEYARGTRFGQRIAHGALVFAISTGLAVRSGVLDEASFVAFYGVDCLRFTSPVFIGDTLEGTITVQEKEERGSNGIVALEVRMSNQRRQDVLVYAMKVLVKKNERGD